MDSDSDNDILTSNNVFTFQNKNMTVCAKGPNMTNVTSLGFRNNVQTSTMQMPHNMAYSRYARSVYEQRSIHCRREVSPMSVRSAYEFQPRNFNISRYPRGISSQRSMMNGRSGSPMSMSMASTTSVSAADIAMAFKNGQFNKHDLKIITEAYHKLVKRKIRKKVEKRRNLRLFLKGARHRAGGESGDQGSDSSLSDDCRSNRTSLFKENMSICRSTRTDLTSIRKTMQESNMYNDSSANFRQKSFKNMFSIDSGSLNSNMYTQNGPLLKDRFKSGHLLPSQRFNKTVAATAIPENMEKIQRSTNQNLSKQNLSTEDKRSKNFMSTTNSEYEEIFEEAPVRQKKNDTGSNRKRCLEIDEETNTPHKKRNKLSPIKNISDEIIGNRNSDQSEKNKNEFVFKKPSFLSKKLGNLKTKEKLISKSPHVEKNHILTQNPLPTAHHSTVIQEKEQNVNKYAFETTQNSNTDVSMRPSFIKRKLFTQRLDVAENKNLSSDNLDNSPKPVYSGLQKEKNKARKLATNQSCLSRDVQEDTLLDLIHKIVPPEQMNSTNQPNKSNVQRNSKDVDDKWDITSIISTCNNDNVSDTYTDEEIFQEINNAQINNNKDNKCTSNTAVPKSVKECQVLLVKNIQQDHKLKSNHKQKEPPNAASANENNVKNSARSFWDTDLESDFECHEKIKSIENPYESKTQGNNKRSAVDQQAKKPEPNKTTPLEAEKSILNNTTTTIHKFNNTSLSIRSHRVTKKKICCQELDQTNSTLQDKHTKPKDNSCLSYTAFVNNVKTTVPAVAKNDIKNSRPKRSCRTPKQTKETAIENKKPNDKTEANRSLRSKKADSSDDKLTTKKSKKQNVIKQSNPANNRQSDKTKVLNSRKSDVSFSLGSDKKADKNKNTPTKKAVSLNNSRAQRVRQSNVSFSITSESPVTRSKTAIISNEKQRERRNNTKINNNNSKNKDIHEPKRTLKTPSKRGGKNGITNMVHDLKPNKSKSVRKR